MQYIRDQAFADFEFRREVGCPEIIFLQEVLQEADGVRFGEFFILVVLPFFGEQVQEFDGVPHVPCFLFAGGQVFEDALVRLVLLA